MGYTKANICVIIPAYNEEASVSHVIRAVRHELPAAEIVVVNDGSTDSTSSCAQAAGASVVDLPFNLGIGGAVQTGLKYAHQGGYDAALEIDADGQHDPRYAPQLIDALYRQQPQIAMVIGSRFVTDNDYRSSVLRRFGIHMFSFLIKLVTGKRIYDSTSGYRAYNRAALQFLSQRYPSDFPEPESIVMLLVHGYKICEIPVTMMQRTTGMSVVGRDLSFKAAYFVLSNAIAILMSGIKTKHAR